MSDAHEKADANKTHLIAVARSELGIRRARLAAFGPGWAGDPWWDILLVLYVERSGRGIDSWSLAGHVGQSLNLADRWLEILQAEGFVRRYGGSADAEIAIFELSPRGCGKVEQCLLGNGDFRC
jgi:hypothetical protein